MKFGRLYTGVVVVVVIAGLTACVQKPPSPESSPGQTSAETSSPAPTPVSTPSSSVAPSVGSTAVPDDGSSPGTKPADADVQILDARFDPTTSGVSIAGMVVNVVSDVGLCTATATQGGVSVSATATSVADASVTYCASLVVQLPPGSTGEWVISLTFDEGATHGSASSSVVVE